MNEKEKRAPLGATAKKVIAIAVSVVLVLAILISLLVVRHVRNNRPPELETVRERMMLLIEASREVNEILWGEGLPTHTRVSKVTRAFTLYTGEGESQKKHTLYYYTFPDATHGTVIAYQYYIREISSQQGGGYIYTDMEKGGQLTGDFPTYRYARVSDGKTDGYIHHNPENGMYYYPLSDFTAEDEPRFYTVSDDADYDYVRDDCGYLTTDDIKAKVNAVYSTAIRTEVNQAVFDGVAAFEGDDGVSFPRYRDLEKDDGSYELGKINKTWPTFTLTDYVYDYDTLRMIEPSKATSVTVSLECYPRDNPAKREIRVLRFVLEGDAWYLDDYTR